ncbi:hypothetical protein K438DRAFT_1808835 [Mycena galopus ATCC 62051]|nr:hypothetical protein K438DRAFT_1808835 [Mycena galopus ATCC 62051]
MYRIHAKETILPPELEREIFELVAVMPNPSGEQYSWDMALNISQDGALVYERIVLLQAEDSAEDSTAQLLLRTIDSRPASFFAEHVKSLYFDKTIQSSTIQPLPIIDPMRYLYQSTSSTIARLLLAYPSLRCFVLGTRSRPNYKWIGKHLREKGFSDRRLYVAPMLVECGWCWPYGVRNLFAEAEIYIHIAVSLSPLPILLRRSRPAGATAHHRLGSSLSTSATCGRRAAHATRIVVS